MTKHDLTIQGRPYRRVWDLAWPLILSNITVPMVGAVDTAVVGHLGDPAYIGGVAIGSMLFNFVYWGFGFLKMGTTGFVALAHGADDSDEIRAVLARALLLAMVLGGAVALLRGPAMEAAFFLLNASEDVERHAGVYFSIRALGAPLALANTTLLGWFLGMQDTRAGLVQLLTINVVNGVLDLIFVFGLAMDVDGVAWASVIGQAMGLAISLWIVRGKLRAVGGRLRRALVLNLARIKAMMSVNRDIFIRTICLLSGTALFNAKSAEMGDVVLAVNAVLLLFQMLSAYGLDGFAHSVEGLVGQAIGKKNPRELKALVIACTVWAAGVAVGLSIFYLVFGGVLIDLFTGIESVRQGARDYLIWAAVLPVISVWAFLLDGIFIGATRSVEMRNAMVLSLIVFVATLYPFAYLFGNHGLWAAYCVLMGVRTITLGVYYGRIVADAEGRRVS
jgi:MATE family multidrug resistance protein